MNPYTAGGGSSAGPNPFGAPASATNYGGQQGYGYDQGATGGYDQGMIFGDQQPNQPAPSYGPAVARPRVDVEATGEVDPNL